MTLQQDADRLAAERHLRRLGVSVGQLQRRSGAGIKLDAAAAAEVAIQTDAIGAGPFGYDYLVDANWAAIVAAGEGTEGQSFTTFHGHTFKVYSTIQAAVNDSSSRDTIGVVPGDYDTLVINKGNDKLAIIGLTFLTGGLFNASNRDVQINTTGSGTSPVSACHIQTIGKIVFKNIYFATSSSADYALLGSDTDIQADFNNCEFATGRVGADFNGAIFNNCYISNYGPDESGQGHTPVDVYFADCNMVGVGISFRTGNLLNAPLKDHTFDNCGISRLQTDKDLNKVAFRHCRFDPPTGGASGPQLLIQGGNTKGLQLIGCVFNHPSSSGSIVVPFRMTGGATTIEDLIVQGCWFEYEGGDLPADGSFIDASGMTNNVINAIISGNTFGRHPTNNDYLEDDGQPSVQGKFSRSIFGPNSPAGKVRYDITNGSNNIFIPESSDGTGLPGSGRIPIIEVVNYYGNMYAYDVADSLTISGTGIANKVQVTSFAANGESLGTTPDHTNDHITINNNGKYLVVAHITVLSAAGTAFEMGYAVYTNNGANLFQACHGHRNLAGGGGDEGSLSMSGILALTAADTLEVWVWNEDNTTDIIIDDISLNVVRVGD